MIPMNAAILFQSFVEKTKFLRATQGGPGVRNYHKPGGKTYHVPGGGKREVERRLRRAQRI